MTVWLLDTGPLIAALDADDSAHERVAQTLAHFRGTLVTTGAVVTEAFYLLRYARSGAERLVEFIEHTGTSIIDIFSLEGLRHIAGLMEKYADCPMDFADASLVAVAEDRGHDQILTLDERGFRTYRLRGKQRFRLVLDK